MNAKKSRFVKIAMIQMDVGPDADSNLSTAKRLIEEASKSGADIACLPELFHYMGSFKNPRDVADRESERPLQILSDAALRYSMYIIGGSVLQKSENGLPFNTTYAFSSKGKVIAQYSKMHLFDINVPDKIRFEESKIFQSGKSASILRTPMGTFGFAICNDLRYPELFRKMALAGADVIFNASAFTKYTGRSHWLALNRVRAIENQCYVVATNQSGKNVEGVEFFGASLAIDPWGEVLAEGSENGSELILFDMDLTLPKRIREELPALKKIKEFYPIRTFEY